ncbi:hypothetical protein EBU95_03895 [bacterium]|nr:hypothetical protein [bacterium]
MYLKIIMYSILRILALIAVSLVFLFSIGCQKLSSSGFQSQFGVFLDSSVTELQKELIEKDLVNIRNVNVNSVNDQDLEILGLNSFNGGELSGWLKSRVKYIAGESFDYQEQAFIIDDHGYLPEVFEQQNVVTVMSNVGGGLYRYGKFNSVLIGINIAGHEFQIKSPRSGIIKIGEGLFSVIQITQSAPDSLANSFLRLHVFFHEGRHSDGNGNNAAFPHESCPSWHDYYGYYACDQSLNGPYTVGALILKNLQKACIGCSNAEIQTMKAIQADSEYRVLPGSALKDARPEKIR